MLEEWKCILFGALLIWNFAILIKFRHNFVLCFLLFFFREILRYDLSCCETLIMNWVSWRLWIENWIYIHSKQRYMWNGYNGCWRVNNANQCDEGRLEPVRAAVIPIVAHQITYISATCFRMINEILIVMLSSFLTITTILLNISIQPV